MAWNDYPSKASVDSEDTLMVSGKFLVTVKTLLGKANTEDSGGTSTVDKDTLDNSLDNIIGGNDQNQGTVELQSYLVTGSYSNCTTDNNLTRVQEGAQYIANITAENSNEELYLTVTMAGVDVTSKYYAYGTINIPSVKGPINITARTNARKISMIVTNSNVETSDTGIIYAGDSVTIDVYPLFGYTLDSLAYEMDGYTYESSNTITRTMTSNGQTITQTGYRVYISSATNTITLRPVTTQTGQTVQTYSVTCNVTGNDLYIGNVHRGGDYTGTVNAGSSFSASVTPIDGYEPDGALVLTMGGQVVTSQYVTGDATEANIYIPSVTGDITIKVLGKTSSGSTTATITKNLTNASVTSGDRSTATIGNSISMTITGVGTVTKRKVTMNGIDITDQLVNDDLSHPNVYELQVRVSGDIVIEFVASGESGGTSGGTTPQTVNLANPTTKSDSSNGLSAAKMTSTWDCVWFGSYPQREVLPTASYSGFTSSGLGSNHDNIIDAQLYNTLTTATGWSGKDITLNGQKYRRIEKTKEDCVRVGTSSSDSYLWSKNTAQYHYFKYEPIKWRVLKVSGTTAFLLTDEIMDAALYHDSAVTGLTWKDSNIRTFCNSDFYNMAFSANEKNAVLQSTVDNSYSTTTVKLLAGSNTLDKVYLLSVDEMWADSTKAKAYGFFGAQSNSPKEQSRMAYSTTFARARGCLIHGASFQWLRSTKNGSPQGCHCCAIGNIGVGSYAVTLNEFGIRPCINLDLSKNLHKYAGTVASNKTDQTGTTVAFTATTTPTTDTTIIDYVVTKNLTNAEITAGDVTTVKSGGSIAITFKAYGTVTKAQATIGSQTLDLTFVGTANGFSIYKLEISSVTGNVVVTLTATGNGTYTGTSTSTTTNDTIGALNTLAELKAAATSANTITVPSWTSSSGTTKMGKQLQSGKEYANYYVKSTADQTPEWYATNSQTAPAGTKASNTYGFYVVGSASSPKTDIAIKDCVFENNTGIFGAYVNNMTIENCYFMGAEQGIYMGSGVNSVTIRNCTFNMNDTNITNYIQGLYFKDGCHNITVENCLFVANGYVKAAFRFGSGAGVADPTSGIRIKNCKAVGKWCWVTQVLEGDDIKFTDCTFDFEARKASGFPTEGITMHSVSTVSGSKNGYKNVVGLTFESCKFKSTDSGVSTGGGTRTVFNGCTFTNITKGTATYDTSCVFN